MNQMVECSSIRLGIEEKVIAGETAFDIGSVEVQLDGRWLEIVDGITMPASTSPENAHNWSHTIETQNGLNPADPKTVTLNSQNQDWEFEVVLELHPTERLLSRRQTWRFKKDWEGALHPGWAVRADPAIRYTYALQTTETPLDAVPPLRADVTWAVPFPFHIWHGEGWLALAGPRRNLSPGTLDALPMKDADQVLLRTYFPDQTHQAEDFSGIIYKPETARFEKGSMVVLEDILLVEPLTPGADPLLEAARLGAGLLLDTPPATQPDIRAAADKIASFYPQCDLWEPDAFGKDQGWFLNMWTYTHGGEPQRRGPAGGFYDLGWGEGIAVEFFLGAVRNWKRTGNTQLILYLAEMTRSIERFRRQGDPPQASAYFDRSDGKSFMDFCQRPYIWLHSLGHLGNQLLLAHQEAGETYPDQETRAQWLPVASSIAAFCAGLQTPQGDIPDVIDEYNQEVNRKSRIPARVVVAGLWSNLARVTGQTSWLDRAQQLARVVGTEIERCAFCNQMEDALDFDQADIYDGEAAYYALEGLVPLAELTQDGTIFALCRRSAAFGFLWTYFYDVPLAYRGIARGGQCCRSNDFPLVYPIGPAKAMEPTLRLWRLTGDRIFLKMAEEMAIFIASYQIEAPGKPWDGALVHAAEQHSGKLWGPEKCGQVDMGMATGNGLAALEYWLSCQAG